MAFVVAAPSNQPVGESSIIDILFLFNDLDLGGCKSFQMLKSPRALYAVDEEEGDLF